MAYGCAKNREDCKTSNERQHSKGSKTILSRSRADFGFSPVNFTAFSESVLPQMWMVDTMATLVVSVAFYVAAIGAIFFSKSIAAALKGSSAEQRLLFCCVGNMSIYAATITYL